MDCAAPYSTRWRFSDLIIVGWPPTLVGLVFLGSPPNKIGSYAEATSFHRVTMDSGTLVVVLLDVRRVAGNLEHTRENDGFLGFVVSESDRVKFVLRPGDARGKRSRELARQCYRAAGAVKALCCEGAWSELEATMCGQNNLEWITAVWYHRRIDPFRWGVLVSDRLGRVVTAFSCARMCKGVRRSSRQI